MNHLTAGESLTRVVAMAAQGSDGDDGIIISDLDYLAIKDVARWLLAGARERGQSISDGKRLPTCTLKELEMAAIAQALEDTGGHKARACAMLGINQSTMYRSLNGISQTKWGRPKGRQANTDTENPATAASQGEC